MITTYFVVVGKLGIVLENCENEQLASDMYDAYVFRSQNNMGDAAHQYVELIKNNELVKEYIPVNE